MAVAIPRAIGRARPKPHCLLDKSGPSPCPHDPKFAARTNGGQARGILWRGAGMATSSLAPPTCSLPGIVLFRKMKLPVSGPGAAVGRPPRPISVAGRRNGGAPSAPRLLRRQAAPENCWPKVIFCAMFVLSGHPKGERHERSPLSRKRCLDRRQGGRVFGDMVDTFCVTARRFAVAVSPVDLVGNAQHCPQVHRLRCPPR